MNFIYVNRSLKMFRSNFRLFKNDKKFVAFLSFKVSTSMNLKNALVTIS